MPTDTLRWGILGVAKINERLIPAFHAAHNAKLAAIASRSPDKVRAAAQAGGIPTAYIGYDALLADPAIDAVYIPLPNTMHAEWVRKAADAGKHVLCEKPMTPTAAEAADLIAYCRSKGVRLMDGFMWPHHERTARVRQLLDYGTIGRVTRVTGVFTFQLDLDPANIRLQPGMAGGALLDVGCYPIYGIRWAMADEPVRVSATAVMLHGVDVNMTGWLEFAGGRAASFDCGFTEPMRQWLEIVGTAGTVTIHDLWLPDPEARYEQRRGDHPVEVVAVGGRDQIVRMIEGFGAAVLAKRDPTPSPDEAVKTLKVLDALALSAREGRVVELTS